MKSRRSELLAFYALLFSITALVATFQLTTQATTNADESQATTSAAENQAALTAAVIPATFNYQGFLRNPDGSLATGSHNIIAKLYTTATGGNPLHNESFTNVTVRDGLFNVVLGANVALSPQLFVDHAPLYLGLTLDNQIELIPRQRLHAVPWALLATNASTAATATTLVTDATVNGLTINGNATTKAIRDIGNSATGAPQRTTYDVSLQRYVVEAPDAGQTPTTVPLDDAILTQLCQDVDGCTFTLGMRNWEPGHPQGLLNMLPPFRFSLSPIDSNGRHTWSAMHGVAAGIDSDNRPNGAPEGYSYVDGNTIIDHVRYIGGACYFTDGLYSGGQGAGDASKGFALLNWHDAFDASGMVCILIIED